MVPFSSFSLNIHGRLFDCKRPQIMGIVNVTPDSFYSASRTFEPDLIRRRVESMIEDGADIIDIGAYSSRPGADEVSVEEECARLRQGLAAVRAVAPDIPVSVDTFRASVARMAIGEGADIINDISGGTLDTLMFDTVAELKVPYILMHMRGTPATMQTMCDYENVTLDVVKELSVKLNRLQELGVSDVIVDPGFGFSKTTEQNYVLMKDLPHIIDVLRRPVLVGISRKSMLTKPLHITPGEALEATVACNTVALLSGASFLRVHDVKAARHALSVVTFVSQPQTVTSCL